MLIGVSGKKGSGKDTLAQEIRDLVHQARREVVEVTHFADPLKKACRDIFELTLEQTDGELKEVLDERWGQTPREILQKFGTEVGRNIHKDTWVRRTIWRSSGFNIPNITVIPDTRFKDEADAIRAAGGLVIRIERPGLVENAYSQHQSETDLDDYAFDYIVDNDLGRDRLRFQAEAILTKEGLLNAAPLELNDILLMIGQERKRQDTKFGEQNHHDVRPGVLASSAEEDANLMKSVCESDFKNGRANWAIVLLEEVFEAIAEGAKGDTQALKTELVQCAAVCVAWVQAIERRTT